MKILVHGYTGYMGQIVCSLAEANSSFEIAGCVSPDCPKEEGICYNSLEHFTQEADCIIDFSNHAATKPLFDYAVSRNMPVVLCTTGQTAEENKMINEASKKVAIFRSANMSLGIAVLYDLAKRAAEAFPEADIEIVEAHHNRKLDVPSGTALLLANGIKEVRAESSFLIGRHENGKRTKEEIGIHSIRLGNQVGMHEIIISTGRETLTLKHQAETRALFADGALAAAKFIARQPAGLYNMQDMLKG